VAVPYNPGTMATTIRIGVRRALVLAILVPAVAGAQTPPPAAGIRCVAVRNFTLVVKADGSVVGWGRDPDGQAARPPSPTREVTAPLPIELPGKVLQVAIGESSEYALLEDGTVVAWGANDEGQLGNGPPGASGELGRYPKPSVAPVRVTGLGGIVQIAAGLKHAVALKGDGTVWAWGRRENGEIGDGEPKGLRALTAIGPVRVPGLEGITQIAVDSSHNLALRSDGHVMAWGSNNSGELGLGTRVTGWRPAEVPGLDRVVAIAAGIGSIAGGGTSGAVRDDGTVWMWGSNASAMIGNGLGPLSPDDVGGRVLAPVPVKGVKGARRLSIGAGHVAALLADGTLRMWGHSGFGQTGVGPAGEYQTTPAIVKHANVAAVYLGGYHSLAVDTDGTLWIWGKSFIENGSGLLGKNLKVPSRLDLN
jgi:alpha-tubulin suppressor-like RCC1 family protein